jgi:hypothetical protein
MNYFLQGFGVFLGVIAGTAVAILTQRFLLWKQEEQKIRNLKFEIQFNIKQIDRWTEYMRRYRDAVNGETMGSWAEYFDFSRIIKSTIEDMIQTGLIYKKLSRDTTDIVSYLLLFISSYNLGYEYVINQEILNQRQNFNKQLATMQITVHEKKLQENKKNLETILKSLP